MSWNFKVNAATNIIAKVVFYENYMITFGVKLSKLSEKFDASRLIAMGGLKTLPLLNLIEI